MSSINTSSLFQLTKTAVAHISMPYSAQQFRFEVGLESPYSWVADISCTTGCTSFLKSELYDPSRSSTVAHISTGNVIHYGSANVSGNFVKDIVRLGPYTALSQFFREHANAH